MVMSEYAAIAAAVNSVNAAFQIAKGALALRDSVKLSAAVSELYGVIIEAQASIFAAQAAQAALSEEKRTLEAKIAEFEKWETEKEKYELKHVTPGALAPMRKPDAQPPEPPHWLCPTCYSNREKHILQEEARMPSLSKVLVCHNCGTDIYLTGHRHPDHVTKKPSPRRRS